MIKLPDIKDLDPGTTLTPICREVFIWGANFAIAEILRLNANAQPVSDGLYRIANHIAGAKNSLPQEWQDWAEEIESDLRKLAAAPGGQDV